jgi:hypothetical protein
VLVSDPDIYSTCYRAFLSGEYFEAATRSREISLEPGKLDISLGRDDREEGPGKETEVMFLFNMIIVYLLRAILFSFYQFKTVALLVVGELL